MRSRAAVSLLKTAGFKTVHSLAGGIHAWQGLTASGPPDAGMSLFPADASAEELIAVAWILEEGSRRFYSFLAGLSEITEAATLFNDLATAEQGHKASLGSLYGEISGRQPDTEFPRNLLKSAADEDRMEGGVKVDDAIGWLKGKQAFEVLEFAMALETDSYDLYIKMGRKVMEQNAKRVFDRLVAEERDHLARMAVLLDKNL